MNSRSDANFDNMVAFATAFGLEALLFNDELCMRIPVAAVLFVVIILVLWCVGVMFRVKTDVGALGVVKD